ALPVKLHEDVDLGAEDVGMKGLEDVVDRAELVAAEDIRLAALHRGEEDDRRVARTFSFTDQRRRLEAVEIGHLHVEEDDRELAIEKVLERAIAAVGAHEVLTHLVEDRLERQKVVRLVVDQQYVDLLFGGFHHRPGLHSSTRNGPMRSRGKIRSTRAAAIAAAGIDGASAVFGSCTTRNPPRFFTSRAPRAPS